MEREKICVEISTNTNINPEHTTKINQGAFLSLFDSTGLNEGL